MKQKPLTERIGDFFAGKGFYIVLFLCVAAIGISGYFLFRGLNPGEDVSVAAPTQVVVTPTPIPPVKPTVPPAPAPTPTPQPTPEPAPEPEPKPAALVFTWPVKGEVVADYSLEALAYDETMADWRTHSGMDIAAELGTQVLATAGGIVTGVYQDDLMGTTVSVDHGNGVVSYYANLALQPVVEIGDSVDTGSVLGAVGNTALAETLKASHLHFAMEQDGATVDPAAYLPPPA